MSKINVLPNRRCGTVKQGGLYACGELSPYGTLNAFTALVAAFDSEIANPRAAQAISIPQTLEYLMLCPPGGNDREYKHLPAVGFADLWGKCYYPTVWSVIEETMEKGISRHIAQVPDIPLPAPVLMMHMDAVIEPPDAPDSPFKHTFTPEDCQYQALEPMLAKLNVTWHYANDMGMTPTVRPFKWHDDAVPSLGHRGDPTFMDHPYVSLYRAFSDLQDTKKLKKFLKDNKVNQAQGLFGLSWITKYVYVLKDDEDTVPDKFAHAAWAVEPGVGVDDPRAAHAQEIDSWADLEEWDDAEA